ncbi:DUF3524 domain-containing protein [Neptuniibacter sp.]|uniref:tRNA-queuosine alpha-mannosyltransferase domain-containing protein n=1 Tax=Neptuniibacter sp. TaxID=1962643 RepID=UPI0026155FC9|nr:DUF3524 domain-containing protein [Neptuniibacter sp.]MCP4597349.1 DUF3524 domain-containing protein [Neptuniibacter sp.]
MKILLLSAYDAESHIYWRQGLVSNLPEHDWTVLSLPGRYFSWRMRGNSLSWAFGERATLEQPYDLVIATSMTDLSALRGFVPQLASIPTLVYFHENQFAYPESKNQFKSVEPKVLNLYTALAADRIVFNSEYNRQTMLNGADLLLRKMPDCVPPGVIEHLTEKSLVLGVPLNNECFESTNFDVIKQVRAVQKRGLSSTANKTGLPIHITWAARWEYDKGPDRLLSVLRLLEKRGVDFRLCIMGQSFKNSPQDFEQIREEFGHRIDHMGYAATKEEYLAWLSCSDIFISTAIHEFQGLSVLEAVAQGCIPVLPDRMSYSEMFSEEYLYACDKDIEVEAASAVDVIIKQIDLISNRKSITPDVAEFSWEMMAEKYRHLIRSVAGEGPCTEKKT